MGISKEQMDEWAPKLTTFEAKKIEWMVKKLIPYGAITLVDGDPGSGKSNLIQWLIASATIGRNWVDGSHIEESTGLVIDCENSIGRSVRRRIENNGGEPSSIRVVNWFAPDPAKPKEILKLPQHLGFLEQMATFDKSRFIVFDTAFNHLSRTLNASSDQDMREALTPLSNMAERLGLAVIIIRHLNKSAMGPALYRGSGSIAFVGVARSVILCAKDPNDPNRKIMAHVKSNEGPLQQSRSFSIVEHADETCSFAWGDPVEMDADELLNGMSADTDGSACDRASDELKQLLSNGEMKFDDIMKAGKKMGISMATFRRAKSYLKVKSRRVGNDGNAYWVWHLPSDEPFFS